MTDAAAHLGIELAEYDARIRTFIPGYDTMLDLVAEALRTTIRRRVPLIVDLGIGTGALSERCLAALPGARIAGVDADEGMLRAARERLGSPLKTTIQENFESVEIPRCDAVVASLALHHIPTPARRLRLFRRIARALRPGGVLVSADCYPASDVRLAAFDRQVWLAHLEQSYTPGRSRAYLRAWAKEDHYAFLIDEISTLRRASFTVDVRGRNEGFAVLVGARH